MLCLLNPTVSLDAHFLQGGNVGVLGATSTEKLIFRYCPSKRGWPHPWPSKNCPWFMPPTDPAVVLESVRYKLMIKQQGEAVRAPALALVVGTGRCVLDAQCPCTKSSPALRRETNWPRVACSGPLSPLPWCKQMLSGHCELLLLQISSPSLPGTFSLDLGLRLSNTHLPLHQMSNACSSTKKTMSL